MGVGAAAGAAIEHQRVGLALAPDKERLLVFRRAAKLRQGVRLPLRQHIAGDIEILIPPIAGVVWSDFLRQEVPP